MYRLLLSVLILAVSTAQAASPAPAAAPKSAAATKPAATPSTSAKPDTSAAAATSASTTREARIRELMEAQGVLQMIEQQLNAGKEEARKQVQQMTDQVLEKLSPPPDQQQAFRKAFDDYGKATSAPWSAKEIVSVWAKAYGSQFTDAELVGLLAYYKSPLGAKDVKASQNALPALTDYFAQRVGPILEKETSIYLDRLEALARACNCPRK